MCTHKISTYPSSKILPVDEAVEIFSGTLLSNSPSNTSKHATTCELFDSTVVMGDNNGLIVTAEEKSIRN